jgi:hypothetical protein
MAKDPVCRMEGDVRAAAATSEYKGRDLLLLRAWLQESPMFGIEVR